MNNGGQGVKALPSVIFIRLFDFALCFLPLRKLPLALFAVIVFPYLWNKKAGKSFYNGLWKFNFIRRFIVLLFQQRHFPFPKRRTRPAGGRNRERVSCSSHRSRLSCGPCRGRRRCGAGLTLLRGLHKQALHSDSLRRKRLSPSPAPTDRQRHRPPVRC